MSNRGRETSRTLTEVRTVLSRARTALGRIRTTDPEFSEIERALAHVVDTLSRWERTGRTKR